MSKNELVFKIVVETNEENLSNLKLLAETDCIKACPEEIHIGDRVEVEYGLEGDYSVNTIKFIPIFNSPSTKNIVLSMPNEKELIVNCVINVTEHNFGVVKELLQEEDGLTEDIENGEEIEHEFSLESEDNFSEYAKIFIKIFNSGPIISRELLIRECIDKEGDFDPKKYMNIALGSLSAEEKKFIEEKFTLMDEALRLCGELTNKLGNYCLFEQKPEKENALNDALYAHIVFLYLIPLALQYYHSIVDSLKSGYKMSAAGLFRALLEVYVDFYYLYFNKQLSMRYVSYYQVTNKWFLDAADKIYDMKFHKKRILKEYQEFINKFKCMSDSELRTWSGISISKMSRDVAERRERTKVDLEEKPRAEFYLPYIMYSRYSAYLHPAAESNSVVIGNYFENIYLPDDKTKEDFIDSIFFDTFFQGWGIIFDLVLAPVLLYEDDEKLHELIENDKIKLAGYYDKFEKEIKKNIEWESLKESFYEKSRREKLEDIRDGG